MSTIEKLWIEIDLAKTRDECSTFRGQLDQKTFDDILQGTYLGDFFTLYNTHWLQEDEAHFSGKEKLKYYIYGRTGSLIGLEGTAFFRAKDIREISFLEQGYSEVFEAIKGAQKPPNVTKLSAD